jgi:phenylacetate-CoA oxygenase PaaJ subunit
MNGVEARLWDALRDVEDPELPVSVVDMGLIVELRLADGCAEVKITFTAMGCPAMEMIIDDVRDRLVREPGVERVEVDVVWEPIWTKERLSPEARSQLREWGISL